MIIIIDINDLATVHDEGTVVRVTGTDAEDPTQRVTFAGDTRSMVGLFAMVEEVGEVLAQVEDYQVLATHVAEACS